MNQHIQTERYSDLIRGALAAIVLMVFLSSVRHVYRMGPVAMWLNTASIALVALALHYRSTRRGWTLWIILLLSCWLIAGFGVVDGLWETSKVFGNFFLPNATLFHRVPPGSFGYLATGLLAGAASALVLTLAVMAYREGVRMPGTPLARMHWVVPTTLISLVAGFIILRDALSSVNDATVKIGVIVPLQGPSATMTAPFLKAVELAVAERKTSRRYELIVADSGANGRDAGREIQRLLYKDRVAAIVGGISLSGEVVKPYAELEKVLHLCVCSVREIGDAAYSFTNIPLPEDEATAWVSEAKARGVRTVAALTQDYPSIRGHMHALTRAIARTDDLRLLYAAEFAAGTTDFSSLIDAAAVTRPDVYMIEAFNPSFDALGRELRRRGIRNIASIVAPSMTSDPALFEGAWYTDSYLEPGFRARYTHAAGGARLVTHMVPYAYDSMNMILDAFESNTDPVVHVRALTSYVGAAGELTRRASEGNFRSRPAVWEIRGGTPTMLHR